MIRIIGHLDSLLVYASCQLDLSKDLVHVNIHVSPDSQYDKFLVHGTYTRSNLALNATTFILFNRHQKNSEIRLLLFSWFFWGLFGFGLRLYVPVNNFSVMSGRSHRFLGITSRGDRGWLMHFLVFLIYLVSGKTHFD